MPCDMSPVLMFCLTVFIVTDEAAGSGAVRGGVGGAAGRVGEMARGR
jgi:hypothetical protein